MSATRDNIATIVAGGRGVRKTSYLKDLIWPLRDSRRIIIVDTFDSDVWKTMGAWNKETQKWIDEERFEYKIPIITPDDLYDDSFGIYRIFSSDTEELLCLIQERNRNCYTIIDDGGRFFDEQLPRSAKKFVLNTKQINVDLTIVFHSLSEVPPKLARWCDVLTLFKTQENWSPTIYNKFTTSKVQKLFEYVQASRDPFIKKSVMLR
jgi:hypothetical protein